LLNIQRKVVLWLSVAESAKTRIALPGKGKSGGARVIYYYLKNHQTVYLLYAFTKGEADNLSAEGKKSMREWSQQIRASYHE
jgi:hypothetical protein